MPLPSSVSSAIHKVTNTVSYLTAPMASKDLEAEQKQYEQEVAEVKAWWQDSRWRFTKRPFTAEQIVSKRGSLKISYPNNEMSKKLWQTVEQRFAVSAVADVVTRMGRAA